MGGLVGGAAVVLLAAAGSAAAAGTCAATSVAPNTWCAASPATFAALQSGAPLWRGGPAVVARPYAEVAGDASGSVASLGRVPARDGRAVGRALRARVPFVVANLSGVSTARAAVVRSPEVLDALPGVVFGHDGERFTWTPREDGPRKGVSRKAARYGAALAALEPGPQKGASTVTFQLRVFFAIR